MHARQAGEGTTSEGARSCASTALFLDLTPIQKRNQSYVYIYTYTRCRAYVDRDSFTQLGERSACDPARLYIPIGFSGQPSVCHGFFSTSSRDDDRVTVRACNNELVPKITGKKKKKKKKTAEEKTACQPCGTPNGVAKKHMHARRGRSRGGRSTIQLPIQTQAAPDANFRFS